MHSHLLRRSALPVLRRTVVPSRAYTTSRPTATATTTTTSPCILCSHQLQPSTTTTTSSSVLPRTRLPQRRTNTAWAATLNKASELVAEAAPSFTLNPAAIVATEMKMLTKNIQDLLSSGHPSLDKVAKYYIRSEGKHLRPLVVLLMARATYNCPKAEEAERRRDSISATINVPITSPNILQDHNPSYPDVDGSVRPIVDSQALASDVATQISPSQKRLAEITEMIHAASLLHDDVIDNAEARRGSPSGNLAFGNKMAILAGDFLLGRASVALARLRDAEVVELLATVIANLVEGEFMQLHNGTETISEKYSPAAFEYYIQKTYLKTASLISKSCRAAALLGGSTKEVADAAYLYGKNLGLSFQLVDDLLDYTITSGELGKPAQADLKLGLATAPVLFAWEQYEELGPMINRKFSEEGDVEKAWAMVQSSNGLERTRELAESFSRKAIEAISIFPDSEAREGLEQIARKGLTRKK
ncbi:coq1 putative hexaprenyl diphosphate synthase [Orbilia oligospora]|uniref:Coq1 putative hexaprenyl diphosphate synthase n=2 Tax=Orbilia oligospora TaxID=2813651 RepID=A0A8H2HI40_ORBOL|nr:coq1 putative hexaprenyl diphosphate synthase [Orbilia oligospora]KAF3269818.1 coq1 putative hexaprenyl diphosphate synthase [Orbilia oligospora]KAF3270270.1 coq1 putative hexaprenyl diphosphate synthase [Orbilia oligospora]KAF3270271.1 coq1 putative hexaprenyl diphosphate synthase, variant 2 [Orbilia oligospora]KAF3274075.1 coq1 putative hexaprenyl diphosphate synthase [Orbilia oligospora]